MNYTYEDALKLVDTQSPASTDEQKKKMAKHILLKMAETGESAERVWNNSEYWKDGY